VKKSQDTMNFNFWHILNNDRTDIVEMMGEQDRFQLERESLHKHLKILKNSIKVMKKDPQLSRLLSQANSERNILKKNEESSNKDNQKNSMLNYLPNTTNITNSISNTYHNISDKVQQS